MTLRIVFMGTPAFAVQPLAALIEAGHELAAVYSQPPRPAGRGLENQRSPVHEFAEDAGLTVSTPRSLKAEAEQTSFADCKPDVAVVVAYGLILPYPVLVAPRFGCLNLHASALPRWRGAAPIHRAVMAGDTMTAATVMRMDEGLDTGPICLEEPVPIGSDTTTGELHDTMARIGATAMVSALAALERGDLVCTPQPANGVTYARKIDKAEARIDFSRSARDVHNLIRALSPFPGAWFEAKAGAKRERIKVLRSALAEGAGRPGEMLDDALTIACGEGAIRLQELQRAGRRPMPATEFQKGFILRRGAIVG